MIRTIRFGDADYPKSLLALKGADTLESFSVEGDFSEPKLRVAIVGAREADPRVIAFVKALAAAVVRAEGVVISGGALGADAAAHLGALTAGGRTWSVLPCGLPHTSPPDNKVLFARIVADGGALIRPFPDGIKAATGYFLKRNGVLVALADIVVIAQAALVSGTRNAAKWAVRLNKPIWVVPGFGEEFVGSWRILDRGQGQQLRTVRQFEEEVLGLTAEARPKLNLALPSGLTDDEIAIVKALGTGTKHPDQLVVETGLDAATVSTALLTLALGDVVVEGSSGLFQRRKPVSR